MNCFLCEDGLLCPIHDQGEYDPQCPDCGLPCSTHEPIQVTDADGNDYETYQCPQPASGSRFAVDNDPVFEPIMLDK
jgi:hypothetical protein